MDKMKIRLYYKSNGEIVSVVLIGEEDWNILEVNNPDEDDLQFTFSLTRENMEKYMENCHEVDLEAIDEFQANENLF